MDQKTIFFKMIHSNALVQKLFYVPFLWKSACSVSQNKTHSKHTDWVGSLEIIWTSNKLSIIFSRIGEPYFHRGGRSPSQVQRGDNLKTQKKKVHSWQMCFFQFKLSLTFFILKQKKNYAFSILPTHMKSIGVTQNDLY